MRAESGRDHRDLYFVNDAHFDADGHALFGRIVAQEVSRVLGGRAGVEPVQRPNQ